MKSVQLTGIRKLNVVDVPTPELQNDTDVLIQIAETGVCGSDVHYYTQGRIGDQIVRYPFTVGHECSGIVVEAGTAVKDVTQGDRIFIEPALSCYRCDQCQAGRTHTCRELKFLGCPGQMDGCLAEYLVMPQESCYKIPDVMSFTQATLIEPLSIGMYAVSLIRSQNVRSIGILGAGPIGLSVLVSAQARGISQLYVTDKLDYRLEVARRQGIEWAGNPDKQDVIGEITELAPSQLDAVIECCGQQEAMDQAVELLKPGGELVLVGIPEVDNISFNISKIRRKELSIQNVRRQNNFVRKAIHAVSTGAIDAGFMVSHRFPMADAAKAFDIVSGYKDEVVKAIVEF